MAAIINRKYGGVKLVVGDTCRASFPGKDIYDLHMAMNATEIDNGYESYEERVTVITITTHTPIRGRSCDG
jgi:hypothetical protein